MKVFEKFIVLKIIEKNYLCCLNSIKDDIIYDLFWVNDENYLCLGVNDEKIIFCHQRVDFLQNHYERGCFPVKRANRLSLLCGFSSSDNKSFWSQSSILYQGEFFRQKFWKFWSVFLQEWFWRSLWLKFKHQLKLILCCLCLLIRSQYSADTVAYFDLRGWATWAQPIEQILFMLLKFYKNLKKRFSDILCFVWAYLLSKIRTTFPGFNSSHFCKNFTQPSAAELLLYLESRSLCSFWETLCSLWLVCLIKRQSNCFLIRIANIFRISTPSFEV